jgi:hypothetical protein
MEGNNKQEKGLAYYAAAAFWLTATGCVLSILVTLTIKIVGWIL